MSYYTCGRRPNTGDKSPRWYVNDPAKHITVIDTAQPRGNHAQSGKTIL